MIKNKQYNSCSKALWYYQILIGKLELVQFLRKKNLFLNQKMEAILKINLKNLLLIKINQKSSNYTSN
jgi:lipid-A-disaccharide synthase-like uncharacterized protein